jgi:antagonist of KipI
MPVAGPMDPYSHRAANLLVGNDALEAALEITFAGPELEFESATRVAVSGAQFGLMLDGQPIFTHRAIDVRAGASLKFAERIRGVRAYLSVCGGIAVPAVLGSRSTHLASHTGGFRGRALKAGDRLPIGNAKPGSETARPRALALLNGGARLRVLPGPHCDRFPEGLLDRLASQTFRVSPQSNRTGYRLEGGRLEAPSESGELISTPMPLGGIQVPRSGEPILLMADHGTIGGYPVVATVITADVPYAAQLCPGDWVRFAPCTVDEALGALRMQEAALRDS